MRKYKTILKDLIKDLGERETAGRIRSKAVVRMDKDGVEVEFSNGRRQKVFAERKGDHYIFTSIVLGRSEVDERGEEELLPLIWAKNRETAVVSFYIDKRGRLAGRIEQLVESLDPEELEFYLLSLARECDVFEHSLGGVDRH